MDNEKGSDDNTNTEEFLKMKESLEAEKVALEKEKESLKERQGNIQKLEDQFDVRVKHYEKLKEQYKETGNKIDRFIIWSLYILLIVTIIYASLNIGITIIKDTGHSVISMIETFQKNDKSTNHEIENKTDTMTLETAEHIFLYLLPLFIILGFFHYYMKNARYSLLHGNTETVDYEDSTRSVNLTKFLFLSSIVSYVIIKVIEEILVKGVTNPTRLISFVILLLLLMSYYIYLDRKKH